MLTRHHWRHSWVHGERVCVWVCLCVWDPSNGPPWGNTQELTRLCLTHTYIHRKTQTPFTWILPLSVCLYLFVHEVGTHTILGYIFCHDCDDDLRFCLVPVMSERDTQQKTDSKVWRPFQFSQLTGWIEQRSSSSSLTWIVFVHPVTQNGAASTH